MAGYAVREWRSYYYRKYTIKKEEKNQEGITARVRVVLGGRKGLYSNTVFGQATELLRVIVNLSRSSWGVPGTCNLNMEGTAFGGGRMEHYCHGRVHVQRPTGTWPDQARYGPVWYGTIWDGSGGGVDIWGMDGIVKQAQAQSQAQTLVFPNVGPFLFFGPFKD